MLGACITIFLALIPWIAYFRFRKWDKSKKKKLRVILCKWCGRKIFLEKMEEHDKKCLFIPPPSEHLEEDGELPCQEYPKCRDVSGTKHLWMN